MRDQEIQGVARKLFPESYTDNWWQRQQDWIGGAKWMEDNSEVPELKQEISELTDKIWDLEYERDEENEKLQDIIKSQEQEIKQLKQDVIRAGNGG